VTSQMGTNILSSMTLSASEINDGAWFNVTLPFSLKVLTQNIEFRVSSNGMTNLHVDVVTVSLDLNYESFSIQRGLQVDNGQITNDSSSQSGRVALSRKGLDEGMLIYGPYITLPNGNFVAVFRIKANETSQNVSVRCEVVSQPGAHILSQRMLGFSEIHDDGAWFTVTLSFSLKVLTQNIEFRVSSNGMTNLYVDEVIVKFQ
jgi:hypothetical protein